MLNSKKHSVLNIFLFVIAAVILWLVFKVENLDKDEVAYIRNQTGKFYTVRTPYGYFPISILEAETANQRTQLTLAVANPTVLTFPDSRITVFIVLRFVYPFTKAINWV